MTNSVVLPFIELHSRLMALRTVIQEYIMLHEIPLPVFCVRHNPLIVSDWHPGTDVWLNI